MVEINTKKAPAAIGPYSQAIKCGNYIFCSGQIALDPKTGQLIKGDIEEQTEQVLENLDHVLEKAGGSLKNIVKTTVYLTDITQFSRFNEIYEKKLAGHKPARATIGVKKLPKEAIVEIEAIAYF